MFQSSQLSSDNSWELRSGMAKGFLFALVRKGSKLNYLDGDGNNQSNLERKHNHQKAKPCLKVNSQDLMIEHKTTELRSTQQVETAVGKSESKRRRHRLFDFSLQKLSKGSKTHRNSPACSNDNLSKEDSLRPNETDTSKSDYLNKAMLVPSVASGYFVHEISSHSEKVATSKRGENETHMPRIVLTDHDSWNSTAGKPVETNSPRIQFYSRYSSFPQLRTDERRKRPSSWNGDESSPHLNDFNHRRSRTTSVEAEPMYSNTSKISGLCVEAIPISSSPSTPRKTLSSANSLRSQWHRLNRPHSTVEWCGNIVKSDNSLSVETKDLFAKRESSWSRGDGKVLGLNETQNSRKIDIFLPSMK